jgi:hypothetical protein
MEQDTDSNNVTVQANRKWIAVLVISCLSIVAYGYMYSENTIGDIPSLLGENLVYVIFVWGIFHTVFGKKQSKLKVALSFLLVYGSLMASSLIGYSQSQHAAKQIFSEIQKDYKEINSVYTDANGLPQRIEKQLNTTPTTKGELGGIEGIIKRLMNQIVSQRNEYLAEIEALGWGKILDPERLKKDKDLIESNTMILKAKDIVGKYRTKNHALLEDLRKDFDGLNVSVSSKQDMLNGFNAGATKARAQIDTTWNSEANTITEFENIFTLLSARKGKWLVQNGQILFESQDDINKFNSYLAAIQDLTSKQEAIQKQNVQKVIGDMEELKN